MQLLLFAASVRKDSHNKQLIQIAAELAKAQQAQVDVADFAEFYMPLYDPNLNAEQGLPESALRFIERLQKVAGVIIASPEYNFSIPAPLKNLIDWISRAKPQPLAGRRILLMSASPSLVGGNRGLWATRVPLEACGAFVFPEMFSLAASHEAFDAQGQLKQKELHERLKGNVDGFIKFAGSSF
jgi:chromate reductase